MSTEREEKIRKIRSSIDKIDKKIIKDLKARDNLIIEISQYKTDPESVIATERQHQVISDRRKWAEEINLDPSIAEKIFKVIISINIEKELKLLVKKPVTTKKSNNV